MVDMFNIHGISATGNCTQKYVTKFYDYKFISPHRLAIEAEEFHEIQVVLYVSPQLSCPLCNNLFAFLVSTDRFVRTHCIRIIDQNVGQPCPCKLHSCVHRPVIHKRCEIFPVFRLANST